MKLGRTSLGLALAALLLCPALAQAQTAQRAFAHGRALLAQGDFRGALASYATAARADRTNQEYLGQYMLLRQAIEMRNRLGTEKDPQKWEYLARALHSFYTGQGIYPEALLLDRKIHARLDNASSAMMLAETALTMNLDAEATQTLASLAPNKSTPSTNALLGVALARQGNVERARKIADGVVLPENAGPGMTYSVARLHAAIGNSTRALQLLTRCFQSVPPSQLAGFKAHVRQSPEFAGLASDARFARVLQTKSKVPESKCSGGSQCAGCPMRGKCGKSQSQ